MSVYLSARSPAVKNRLDLRDVCQRQPAPLKASQPESPEENASAYLDLLPTAVPSTRKSSNNASSQLTVDAATRQQ